jgi:opine dehydrogenase
MNVTIIGAGNSGLAMAAHLSKEGHQVTLWNRSRNTISKLMNTHLVYSKGCIEGKFKIHCVTDDIVTALKNPEVIFITTPASSHKELAELIAKNINKEAIIVLNPGRTFGALEFYEVYHSYNKEYNQIIAETQTIIYTCRKTSDDTVNILAFKEDVLISTFDGNLNDYIISELPECLQRYFIPAESMIETSIGNVGMILHCAPLLLNTGWTENKNNFYKYYYDGITPSIAKFIEQIDNERILVSEALGYRVETTQEWLKRTYNVTGNSLYECIQNNDAYKTISAPESLYHRYIFEDVPCGLVPLEEIGKRLGINMNYTSLVIKLASKLLDYDFRENGRHLSYLNNRNADTYLRILFKRRQLKCSS